MARPGRPATADPTPSETGGDDPEPEERGPLRCCAVTRERLPKERMIRFVIGPDRNVAFDLTGKLPGRGIWLSARADVIETACKRGAFAKAARGPVVVPPDLRAGLQAALTRRFVDHLGLARRAGQAVAGFVKAREWLSSGRAALVIQAVDGSAEERDRFLGGWDGPVMAPLDGERLGAVFGRDRAVHVAVAKGRLAETLRHEAGRLAGLAEEVSGKRPDNGLRTARDDAKRREKDQPHGVAGRNDVQDAGR